MRRLLGTLQQSVTSPLDSLTSWQRAARWIYDFVRHGWRQLSEDDAPSLAAALTFRVLFSLLPVLFLVTIMARAFLLEPGRAGEAPAAVSGEAAGAGSAGQETTLRSSKLVDSIIDLVGPIGVEISGFGVDGQTMDLKQFVGYVIGKAEQFNLSTLGWLSGLILIYSAIALMVTIENAFNRVMRAPSGRPWSRRIPLYWFVLTVGPILIGGTPYLNAKYMQAVESLTDWQALFAVARFVWNFGLIWVFMVALFMWVPNTTMQWRAVFVGALVSAILLEVGKRSLGVYLGSVVARNPLLASLGLLPLVMFWIYAMWMVVLFGLEVTSMIQHLRGRRMEEMEHARPRGELVDSTSVLAVMQAAATRFREGQTITAGQLAEATGIPPLAVAAMVDRLVQRGFLHRLEGREDALALARPAETIGAEELIKVGWELAATGNADSRVAGVIDRLREAQSAIASGTTLSSLTARAG